MNEQDADFRVDKIESSCGDIPEPWRLEMVKHLNLVEAERDRLKVTIIELQQEINCLRMEPCQLPKCVEERDKLKAELDQLKWATKVNHDEGEEYEESIKADRDKWRDRCSQIAQWLEIEHRENVEGLIIHRKDNPNCPVCLSLAAYDSLAGEGKQ